MSPVATLRNGLALLLTALVVSACPALLDDDFTTVPATGPDAGVGGSDGSGGSSGGDASADGGSAGTAGSQGVGGGGTAGSGDGGDGEAGTCNCIAGELCCEGTCVDRMTSRANCGSCGTGCPGTTCASGQCSGVCALGFLDCDHNAVTGCEVNAATDPENCGSCGIECPFEATCMMGKCTCPEGTENCNGLPGDGCEASTDSDPDNCGACGKSCGANQQCAAGVCVCNAGFDDCNTMPDDGCEADLSQPATCGSCSKNCGSNSTCSGTTCGCRPGSLNCDTAPGCEATASNPQTCGGCSTQCSGSTPFCNGTTCAAGCGAGQTLCNGVSCVNLQADSAHCGVCNRALEANQVCTAGVPTCVTGFANCNGLSNDGCEIDTRSDVDHCGSCPNACKPGAICSGSTCSCAASTPIDCGTSCRQCCGAANCSDGDLCTTDSCTSGGTCAFSTTCAGGGRCCAQQGCFECCGDSDCSGGTVCSSNRCVLPTCTAPQILCGPGCVNPLVDAKHCGGCDNDCGPGRSCSGGQCTPKWVATAAPLSGFVARSRAASTWTGTHVFIWGGQNAQNTALNTAALYNPLTNTWTSVAVDANTPSPRVLATAVWTGSMVVIWGGGDAQGNQDYRDGGRWNPSTNSWQPITLDGAPAERRAVIGRSVGSRVLFFWGGFQKNGAPEDKAYLYDPEVDTWTQTSSDSQPPKLLDATTGWSGTDFYVYGGQPDGVGSTNGAWGYDPALDRWRTLPSGPSARYGALGAWDGSYFIAWGGRGMGNLLFADGQRFNPAGGGAWTNVATTGAPSARRASERQAGWAARVSGGNLLILGGLGLGPTDVRRDGAVYNSTTNSWSPVAAWPSAEQHLWASAVWTGSEFVLWGGLNNGLPTATGERLRP